MLTCNVFLCLNIDLPFSESDDGTNARITKETDVHPLKSAKDEKLGHVAAAKGLSNMTDGKQSSSPNQQGIDQGGHSVRITNPNISSSGM